jgi:pyruvate formate lyase activating enzyme
VGGASSRGRDREAGHAGSGIRRTGPGRRGALPALSGRVPHRAGGPRGLPGARQRWRAVAARALEPIEKKPFYHFHPGARVYSLGPYGCNLHCAYCQNWRLSQRGSEGEPLPPEAAVAAALAARARDPRVVGLAFTYTEPLVWFEYVRDVAALARPHGLRVVLKTAGYVSPEPLGEALAWVDALNVDVKAFREAFYRSVCGGGLAPVRRAVEAAVRAGRHVEVTTLVVPGRNDDPGEMEELAAWLGGMDARIPLHLPRFYPNWRLGGRPPGEEVLGALRQVARRHLMYVYVGGTWRAEDATTRCPACGAALIRRDGLRARAVGLERGACAACGRPADLVGAVADCGDPLPSPSGGGGT